MGRSGVVLAGGRGRRLGLGVPKAGVELLGRTLLERAVETLVSVCAAIVVVAPPGVMLPASRARRIGDAEVGAGPLAGLVAGLEALSPESCAVLGVDFPLVAPGLIEALFLRLEAKRGHPACEAVVPRPGGIPQPLVAVYAAGSAPRLRRALERGVTSIRVALESLDIDWLGDEELAKLPGGPERLLNVNTRADLDEAKRRLASGAPTPDPAPRRTSGGAP